MVIRVHDIPGEHRIQVQVPDIPASQATDYVAQFVAPFDCNVVEMAIVPADDIVGDATNTVNFNVDGPSGATEVANLDVGSGVTLSAATRNKMTISASGGEVALDQGQTLRLECEEVGTGQAADIKGLVWEVVIEAK